ncbi:MAG: lactate utilization protein, partial [Anaerolineae bacterium]
MVRMTPFRQRIREALANPALQSALDKNAERRKTVRARAFASLPEEGRPLKARAHQIRQDVIGNLDALLETFVHNAQANGLRVHRAANAAEARRIVLDIVQQHNARLVAKSKSMVSEEIGLNAALEAAGVRVVETDLGEFIVQLRGEKPAHIITPAVHLRREDVGRTFAEKLGIPYTTDVAEMNAAARRTLREVFLRADVGISGVNFGVAESGTLCIVTNEGNGRMVTTLPKVHIALMGMERLVPRLDDLAVMLDLLPRSATGQKLTTYVSLLNRPRQPDDPDGPQERHVIILDNGRG